MLTDASEPSDYFVSLGNLVFNAVDARRGGPEDSETLFQALSTLRQTRKRWRVVIKVVVVHERIHRVKISFVNLLIRTRALFSSADIEIPPGLFVAVPHR
jgi:hypothetical protein